MRDLTIDFHIARTTGGASYAYQVTTPATVAPVKSGAILNATPARAAVTGMIAVLGDTLGNLGDGDTLQFRFTSNVADNGAWISTGSGDPELDGRMRTLILAARRKGVSVFFGTAADPVPTLKARCEMAAMLGY